ncbi:MAG: pyridoxal-phosphate dependent enzyme [Phycisphaerales bacterium]|nr:pyridoxal-phosphate dependent enzyme [Phycisphaerales bacterium]
MMPGIAATIRYTVGNTPLVRAARFAPDLNNELLIKLEYMNPGGSVKDRIAFEMVEDAVARGVLRAGGEIVEATAGCPADGCSRQPVLDTPGNRPERAHAPL